LDQRGADLSVEVVDTTDKLRELSQLWTQLEEPGSYLNPFLTWEWQWSWWETFGAAYEPRFLLMRRGEELLGLVPLCTQKADPATLQFTGGLQLSDCLGLLALAGSERAVAAATLAWAQRQDAVRCLDLHFLAEQSASMGALRAEAEARGLAVEEELEAVSPGLNLPPEFDAYLATSLGKKDRHELRRKYRRLDQERPGWKLLTQDDVGLERALQSFLHLLGTSGDHKQAFLSDEVKTFFGLVSQRLNERGWLRIQLLESDGDLLAAIFGFTEGGVWHLYNSGYDPQFGSLSPGLLCVAEGIRAAISEHCRYADMLRGDEPYKYRLGASDQGLCRLQIKVAGS
jgi:CelD/BcsL family acetyltransferase involved in cellulose biosynthesis